MVKLHKKISAAVYRDSGVGSGKQIVATLQRKLSDLGFFRAFWGQCFAKRVWVWCNRHNFLN
jgi:hypothetical protein